LREEAAPMFGEEVAKLIEIIALKQKVRGRTYIQ
jgi:hypothetical protein